MEHQETRHKKCSSYVLYRAKAEKTIRTSTIKTSTRSTHFPIAESNLTTILNERYLNTLIARDMAKRKVFASVRRDASNAQEIIQPSIIHAGRSPRTLNAKAKVSIQLTIKAV